ncbi:MAG: hypothetical protein ACRDKE_09320, partial [Solirubrobacterales bacterium]
MRRVRPLALALFIAAVTLMGLATSASAGISNLNAEYVQDPTTPTNITVNWSFDQTDFPFYGNSMQVFATTVDWPGCSGEWPFSTRWVNSALQAATFHNGLKDAHHEGSDTISVPAGRSLCVGVAVYDETVTVYDAAHFNFDKPTVDDSFEGGKTTTTIGHEIKITPNGLPTKYHLEYFKPNATTDCNAPDPEDLETKQETEDETISDDLYGEHTVYPEITGLEPQTTYCVRLDISNAQGEYFAYFWARDTAIPIPILANESYTGQDGYIKFEIDVTPGAISMSTSLYFQYFEKVGSTCTLVPGEESTYNFHSLTPSSGTVMTHHFGSVPNLEAHKYYCVRAYATNPGGGTTPGAFHTVRTVIQSPVTLSYEYFQPPTDIDNYDINFAIGVDDSGAYEDLGENASMELNQYRVPASECNAEGVSAAEPIFSADEQFGAGSVSDFDYDLVAGPR